MKKSALEAGAIRAVSKERDEKPLCFTKIPILGRRSWFGAEIAHYCDEAGPNLTQEMLMKPKAKPSKQGKTLGAKKLQKKIALHPGPGGWPNPN